MAGAEVNGRLDIILEDILANQRETNKKIDGVAKELHEQINDTRISLETKIEQHKAQAITRPEFEAQKALTTAEIARVDKLSWKNVSILLTGIVLLGGAVSQMGNLLNTLTNVAKAFGGP